MLMLIEKQNAAGGILAPIEPVVFDGRILTAAVC